jgi:flagellar protein FlbT
MKTAFKISLKAGEKIYVNGAVIKAERKTTLEFLNDVNFLLESHVLQVEDATTPLRQLYFIVQIMLMNPSGANDARVMFRRSLSMLLGSFENPELCARLKDVDRLVMEGDIFEALRAIRTLYPAEAAALAGTSVQNDNDAAVSRRPYAIAVGE